LFSVQGRSRAGSCGSRRPVTTAIVGQPFDRDWRPINQAEGDTENPRRVFISGQKRSVFGVIKRELRRRSAIEGDAANAVLSAVGHNLRLVFAWLRTLLCLILIALRKIIKAPPKIKSAS
jgi:transposase, IS5 family